MVPVGGAGESGEAEGLGHQRMGSKGPVGNGQRAAGGFLSLFEVWRQLSSLLRQLGVQRRRADQGARMEVRAAACSESGIGGAGHRKRSHSARQRPIRQPPPMPPPPPPAAASTAPQVAHRYVKQRRQFGRHPHFTDQGAEVRHAGVDIGTLLRICWHPHIAAPCSPSRRRACLLLVAPTCCSCCWTCGPMKSMPRRG